MYLNTAQLCLYPSSGILALGILYPSNGILALGILYPSSGILALGILYLISSILSSSVQNAMYPSARDEGSTTIALTKHRPNSSAV